MNVATLADRIDALLPQTQCTKCGYAGCRPYAEALAAGTAPINQCPPGGRAGIAQLAALLQRPMLPLNPANGTEDPLAVAVIDEARCIGCTLCIQDCPVDAIVGAPRRMHTVLAADCTGCELCLPPCPVDCIEMIAVQPPRTWTPTDADAARSRFTARRLRLDRDQHDLDQRLAAKAMARADALETRAEPKSSDDARKQAIVQAALERARTRRRHAA